MFDIKIFGERLRAAREQKGISQKSVAELLGVTRTQISDIENGKTGTSMARLVTLAEFYHVSTDYLLGITDDPVWRGK